MKALLDLTPPPPPGLQCGYPELSAGARRSFDAALQSYLPEPVVEHMLAKHEVRARAARRLLISLSSLGALSALRALGKHRIMPF